MKKKIKQRYYVSIYERYDIYAPEEGGYCYNGWALDSWIAKPFKRYSDATRYAAQVAKVYDFNMHCRKEWWHRGGSDYEMYIERTPGEHERGWHPYE